MQRDQIWGDCFDRNVGRSMSYTFADPIALSSTSLVSASTWSEAVVVGNPTWPCEEDHLVCADANRFSLPMFVEGVVSKPSRRLCAMRCDRVEPTLEHRALNFKLKGSRQHSDDRQDCSAMARFFASLTSGAHSNDNLHGHSIAGTDRLYRLPTSRRAGVLARP